MGTGVESVDQEHQELVRMLNQLMEACDQGKAHDEIGKMIAFLGEYAKTHFSNEESIMDTLNCPVAARNKAAHAKFLAEFTEMAKEFEAEGPTLAFVMTVQQKIIRWLMSHIEGCDRQLKECVTTGSA